MRPASAMATLIALLAVAVPARGQAIQRIVLRNAFAPVGAGARGLGMGGAFIAVADDGTAATFNPAGLAQLRRSELALVAFGSDLTRTSTDPPGAAFTSPPPTSEVHQAIDFVGLALPYEVGGRRIVFQVSYQRAVDLVGEGRASFNQPGATAVVIDIDPQQRGALHSLSGTLAYQLTSRLSVGASVNYWIGEWTASGTRTVRTLGPALAPGGGRRPEQSRTETEFTQDQSLRGLNVNAGFLLRYARVSIGGALRSPFSGAYDLSEQHREVSFTTGTPSPAVLTSFDVTSQLHWPRTAGIGVAVRPVDGLTVATDYSASRWSATYIEALPAGALLSPSSPVPATGDPRPVSFADRSFFDLDDRTITRTADTTQWRAGVEYLLLFPRVVVPLRAGLFRDRSPITDPATNDPRAFSGFTVGSGLNLEHVVLDVAFERRHSDSTIGLAAPTDPRVGGNPNERVTQNRFVASFIYRFDPDDRVKRWFGRLLGGGDAEDPTAREGRR